MQVKHSLTFHDITLERSQALRAAEQRKGKSQSGWKNCRETVLKFLYVWQNSATARLFIQELHRKPTQERKIIMILKVNDTEKFNISMTLHIDDKAGKITVHIKHWDKQTGVINGYDYPAAEYSKALAKFKAINILWDVDYYDDGGELPTEIDIPEGMTDEDEISDYLSEVTGYCHQGYVLEGK